MENPPELLLQKDLRAFMEVARNHDPQIRFASLKWFDDLMTCELVRHGLFRSETELPGLVRLYEQTFLPAPVDRRKAVFEHVRGIVDTFGGELAAAFKPFMLLDNDIAIISTAVIDYCSYSPLIDDDPMSRPKDVAMMIKRGIPRNPAAVIGGLLALGDPRVCSLVRPLRDSLSVDQWQVVTNCYSGLTYKCNVEFYLDWLDEIVDLGDHNSLSMFGHVAAGLYRQGSSKLRYVLDGKRPFPFRSDAASQTMIPFAEFASSISDRLYDLERRECAPKVMPHVMQIFGLTPTTSPDEWSERSLH